MRNVHTSQIYLTISYGYQLVALMVIEKLVTPRYRATSAPRIPYFFDPQPGHDLSRFNNVVPATPREKFPAPPQGQYLKPSSHAPDKCGTSTE